MYELFFKEKKNRNNNNKYFSINITTIEKYGETTAVDETTKVMKKYLYLYKRVCHACVYAQV